MKSKIKYRPLLFGEISALKSDMSQICLSGDREAVVEGVLGILEYDRHKIRLRTGSNFVSFIGNELFLRSLNPDVAVVSGQIKSVEFGGR